ncbi:MAG: 6-pyruvoyl tetrahydropterin synthase family protein [Methanomassiliicoccales archaeon]|nr:MAG: 6-pyruvoyl tetrahydropterin synthase family protein [Methanomassiliicoccales archaeon]
MLRLEVDGEHANIKFSACHFIAGHDKCGRLHGHSYIISLKLYGETTEGGMIMDFVAVKKALRDIADELDHRVLIPSNSNKITVSVSDEVVVLSGCKKYIFPVDDVVLLDTKESSAEELASCLLGRFIQMVKLPPNIIRVELGIHEELGQSAWAGMDLAPR